MYEIGEEYLVGDAYEIGDEVDSLLSGEVGATRRGSRAMARRMPSSALQARLAQQGTLVRESAPTRARQYPLGFDSGVAGVAGGATAAIQAQPQVVFRPSRLIVPAAIAPAFILNFLTIGKDNMFASAGALPCEAFTNTAVATELKLATAQVSSIIVMNVTNVSAGLLRFMAVLIGDAIE